MESAKQGKFLNEQDFEFNEQEVCKSKGGKDLFLGSPLKWRKHKQETGKPAFFGWKIFVDANLNQRAKECVETTINLGGGTVEHVVANVTADFKCALMETSTTTPAQFKQLQTPCVSFEYLLDYLCMEQEPNIDLYKRKQV